VVTPHATAGSTILVLNFDALQCGEAIGNYYSGSTGSLGSGPGPNYGVSFTALALVTTDTNSPQTGTCAGNQTVSGMPSESNAFSFSPDAGAAASMNVPGGFTTGLSFFYLPDGSQHSLTLWDGVNGSGDPVTVVSLPPGTQGQWTAVGIAFSGTVRSVKFGSARGVFFDNITLGASQVTNPGKSAGDPSKHPGSCACGDPINLGTGALFEKATDYTTTGANPLAFIRYYNSLLSSQTQAFSMGPQWRSNYDRYLNVNSSTSVTVERADGRQVDFHLVGNTWTPDGDVDATLTLSGAAQSGTWTFKDSTDTTETYTTVAGQSFTLLQTIQARNGYTQTLGYDTNFNLISVTDSYNRKLAFTYNSATGILQTVTTPDGLVLTYAYTAIAAGPQLTEVSYSTTPATSQTYVYENPSLPLALTGIVDELGNRFATWTYDASGRGLTSQHAGGANLTTFTYNDTDGSRTVTNGLGEQEVYRFTTLQGVPKLTEIDRVAAGSIPAATRLFTYDANGYTASQIDWNGNLTTYVNDIHGQPTTINEAVNTPQARTTTITYDTTWVHLPKTIVTPGLTTSFLYDANNGNLLNRVATDTTSYYTNGTARVWTYTWSNFLLASAQGPRSDVNALTRFTYDASGALTKITNALNQATQITQHLPGGLPQTMVDPNGVTTQFSYDARQRLLAGNIATTTGPLVIALAYDGAGNLLTATLPDGSALTATYDGAHRVTAVTDLFGQKIAYTLDALGGQTQTNVLSATAAVVPGTSLTRAACCWRKATTKAIRPPPTTFTWTTGGPLRLYRPVPARCISCTTTAWERRKRPPTAASTWCGARTTSPSARPAARRARSSRTSACRVSNSRSRPG